MALLDASIWVAMVTLHRDKISDRFAAGIPVKDPRALLNTREAAGLLDLSPSTLSVWRWKGEGPPVERVDGKPRYRYPALVRWIEMETAEAAHHG